MTRLRSTTTPGVLIRQYQNGTYRASRTVGGVTSTMEDVNHGRITPSRLGGSTDVGGPMLLNRSGSDHTVSTITSGQYKGTQVYLQGIGLATRPTVLTDAQVMGEGATAIARSTPTNPVFDASVFIGETYSGGFPIAASAGTLKDTVARFKDIEKSYPNWHKPASSAYLEYQFGWLPFVSDVRNFARAARDSTQILLDLKQGSGKNTRVGYQFPEQSTFLWGSGNRLLVRPDNVSWGSAACTWTQRTGAKLWFNGCFTYYIPMGDDVKSKMQRYNAYANRLYGVRVTPSSLWNLTPWSWALDWFGNTGDVLSNFSALGNDGLVLKYGYMMYHNYTRSETKCAVVPQGTPASVVQVVETKKRFQASPYRLFAGSGELTPRQIAIIGALGLNRVGQ